MEVPRQSQGRARRGKPRNVTNGVLSESPPPLACPLALRLPRRGCDTRRDVISRRKTSDSTQAMMATYILVATNQSPTAGRTPRSINVFTPPLPPPSPHRLLPVIPVSQGRPNSSTRHQSRRVNKKEIFTASRVHLPCTGDRIRLKTAPALHSRIGGLRITCHIAPPPPPLPLSPSPPSPPSLLVSAASVFQISMLSQSKIP